MKSIDDQIQELEFRISLNLDNLNKLKQQKKKIDTLGPEYALADYIHTITCHLSHEGMCGYFYESWDKPGWSRKGYLDRAKKIINGLSVYNNPSLNPMKITKLILESV